jgi:hypothetical protein
MWVVCQKGNWGCEVKRLQLSELFNVNESNAPQLCCVTTTFPLTISGHKVAALVHSIESGDISIHEVFYKVFPRAEFSGRSSALHGHNRLNSPLTSNSAGNQLDVMATAKLNFSQGTLHLFLGYFKLNEDKHCCFISVGPLCLLNTLKLKPPSSLPLPA